MATDLVIRVVIVAVLAAAVILFVRLAARRGPSQRRIRLTGMSNQIVLFTSTDCTNCAAARQAFRTAGVAIREVTWELEGHVLEAAGVTEVPTAIVLGANGETLDQVGGVPSSRRIRRMASMLGADPGSGYRTSP